MAQARNSRLGDHWAIQVAALMIAAGALSACGSEGASGGPGAGSGGSGATSGGGSGAKPGQGGSSGASTTGGTVTTGAEGGVGNVAGEVGDPNSALAAKIELPIPREGQVLTASTLANQLTHYDPGSLLRCSVAEDAKYRKAIDALGGVSWGYNITALEDSSKPRYLAGVERIWNDFADSPASGASPPVEIVAPDIVAVTDAAALFHSSTHGLMIVGLDQLDKGKPEFRCAVPLPGIVDQFFFHGGELVVMTKSHDGRASHLLHFKVQGSELQFVEDVDLGAVSILDSRRFNDKLVFYTSFSPRQVSDMVPSPDPIGGSSDEAASQGAAPTSPLSPRALERHRALRVFALGDKLEEELYDTLLDTSEPEAQLVHERITREMPIGTLVSESRSFGQSMWASDHYFVVTEQIAKTSVEGWRTLSYSSCTQSHTVPSRYEYCETQYETRPNPDYVAPDNSGGDRACHGTTLSDCLIEVARVANKTIQVPVGRKCEEREYQNWVCDHYELVTNEYPELRTDISTRLYIYEYTESGFVRVDSSVHEVNAEELDTLAADATVKSVRTSAETYDLAVPGGIQTLYFQNGFLYVVSQGVLQVYAMGGGSIVRTSTLPVVNETLQSSLFSKDKLILSDFGWASGDHSTLRVINLSNPAFPKQDGATHELPGGHRSIIAADSGIFTIGSVQSFMGQQVSRIKLGLFSDPYAEETAYSILGTDLKWTWLQAEETQFFNAGSQRLALPYAGQNEDGMPLQRVGFSRVVPGSIVSEGAVVVPEAVQRVRPIGTQDETYLTFANSSVEWVLPNDREWRSEPVLEYLEPFAIYRQNADAEYVELQRLGTRCRLYFAQETTINDREHGLYSQEFACVGYTEAYDKRFLFGERLGIEYDDEHEIRALSPEEVSDTLAEIRARPVCLQRLELADDVNLDPKSPPAVEDFTCMSPEEYGALRNRLSQRNN
ncbi:MAG TPA: hypothetical protein VFQ61_25715 [Polyangiaceae bacterium]|nr:hypothetical protein [Polyangiaceae bacterium]